MKMSDISKDNFDKIKGFSSHVDEFLTKVNSYTGALIGYKSKFVELDKVLDGLQPGLTFVAGRAHHGKTMKMLNWAWSIAENNKSAHVIFESIDDSRHDVIKRLISMMSKQPMIHVGYPKRFLGSDIVPEKVKASFKKSFNYAVDIVKSTKNWELNDVSNGRSLEAILARTEEKIKQGKDCVLFIDNFHNIEFGKGMDDNSKFSEASKILKEFGNNHDIPICCTVKLRKASMDYKGIYRRPHIDEIKNSVDIQFDADVILGIYNHYIASDKSSDLYDVHRNLKCPVIETHVLKSKKGDCHDFIYDTLHGSYAWLEEKQSELFEEHKAYIDNYKAKNSG